MDSLERVRRAAKLEMSDCVPVGPYLGNHGAHVTCFKLGDYCTNGKIMAAAQYAAWELYGQDIVVAQSDNYYIAEGFGSEVIFYEDSTPTLKKPAIETVLNVKDLKVPKPWSDGRMPVYLEAIQLLSQKTGGKICIRAPGTGPFSLASHLIGVQEFLTNIADAEYCGRTDLEVSLFQLMELTSDALIEFSKAALKAGANIVQCGDSLASLDMISPAIYRKYAYPYEKKVFEALKPDLDKYKAHSLLHICGDNTKVMELHADTGATILEVDYKVDLKAYKKKIGNRICIMGNVDPTGILLWGTPDDVVRESRQCIQKAATGGGFILGSGCEVPIHAPRENIMAMISAAREYNY